jgi:D-alanyl-D-alanine carboxypeptidase
MYPTARRLLAAFCFAIASLGLTSAASAQVPYAQLSWGEPRYAAIVVDANTGEVLYDRNADSPRHPASITKIMTMYLAFEALASGRLQLTDTLTISPHAASMAPTKLGLRPGDTITVDEALRAIAVKSANDMAVALAEKLGGDEERFSALMTLRAQELGMTNTRYVNASGLPDNRQISSARDIALLSRSVMRDFPQYYSYFGLHQFTYRGATISNHNHLLDSLPGVDGLKTGFTNASGYNLAVSAVQGGRRLIAVVMGGNTYRSRDANATDLLQTGFMVMARRDRGENIQLAQNLFEQPEPIGPVMRPTPFSQGDADTQRGLRIVLTNEVHPSPLATPVAMRPIANPPQPVTTEVADEEIVRPAPVKLVKVTEIVPCKPAASHGRKGKGRHRAAARHETCEATKLMKASDVKPCKSAKGKGRHHKTECAAVQIIDASDREVDRHGHDVTKAVLRSGRHRGGDWLVQVGAFKEKAQARKQLAKLSHSFSEQFADAETEVEGASGGLFRARFTGFSASAAREACAVVKAHGHACTAMNAG